MNELLAMLGTPGNFPILALIPFFPLLGAVANGLVLRPLKADRGLVEILAVFFVGISFVLSVLAFASLVTITVPEGGEARLAYEAWEWFSTAHIRGGDIAFTDLHVGFAFDALSGVMCLVITGIGLLIHVYSVGYMHEEPAYHRFFACLNLFTAAMLVLVLGDSLPVLFIGWEGVGLCSYLLIGFWYQNTAYAAAGKKAFIVNRIGDVGVIVGIFVIAAYTNAFDFEGIRRNAHELDVPFTLAILRAQPVELFGMSAATLACVALFLGCAGKSAQIPLYVWLPDAMAGPTPVSALIHAATMVTAGVYLVARLSSVFVLSPTALAVIATIGALTALFAASIGLVQNEMKKVLAYSTVSQLGFMFLAAGVGAFSAAFFHVFTHAFFKACLFLAAGSVMHAVGAHGDVDVRTLGGLRTRLKSTHLAFLLGAVALAGVPLTSGFFSKDEILYKALATENPSVPWLNPVLFGIGVAAAFMTAFYIFRVYFLTFHGTWRGGPAHDDAHQVGAPIVDAHPPEVADHAPANAIPASVHESGSSMTIPLLILGAGAIVAGFLGIPHWTHLPNIWDTFVEHSFATAFGAAAAHGGEGAAASAEAAVHGFDAKVGIALASGVTAMAAGLGLAWTWYLKGDGTGGAAIVKAAPWLHRAAYRKYYVDEIYDATIVALFRGLARLFAAMDRVLVDGILVKLTALVVTAGGHVASRLQTGRIQTYGAGMAIGIAAVVWWVAVPHVEVRTKVDEGGSVTFEASAGPGYRYRWKALDDARPDTPFSTEWSEEREVTRSFTKRGPMRVELEVRNALGHRSTETIELNAGVTGPVAR